VRFYLAPWLNVNEEDCVFANLELHLILFIPWFPLAQKRLEPISNRTNRVHFLSV